MENRRFTRVQSRARVRIEFENRPWGEYRLRDLSWRGAYIQMQDAPPEGMSGRMTIILEAEGRVREIRAVGVVVRAEAEGAAIQITEIDIESVNLLRNLLRFNAPSPDAIDDEIQTSVDFAALEPSGTRPS